MMRYCGMTDPSLPYKTKGEACVWCEQTSCAGERRTMPLSGCTPDSPQGLISQSFRAQIKCPGLCSSPMPAAADN